MVFDFDFKSLFWLCDFDFDLKSLLLVSIPNIGLVAVLMNNMNAVVVADEFTETLQRYTSNGLRVIAFAMKSLDSSLTWKQVQRISR